MSDIPFPPLRRLPGERDLTPAERAAIDWPPAGGPCLWLDRHEMDMAREVATTSEDYDYILRIPALSRREEGEEDWRPMPIVLVFWKPRGGEPVVAQLGGVVMDSTDPKNPDYYCSILGRKDGGRGTS